MHGFFVVMKDGDGTIRKKLSSDHKAKMVEPSSSGLLCFYFDLPSNDSKQDWHLTGTSFLKVSEFVKELNPQLLGRCTEV